MKLHYFSASVKGQHWEHNYSLDGNIATLSTSLLLERYFVLGKKANWRTGFAFGMGFTKEYLQNWNSVQHGQVPYEYPTVSILGIVERKISNCCAIRIQPTLMFQDPINGIRAIRDKKGRLGKEDYSLLIDFGIIYQL